MKRCRNPLSFLILLLLTSLAPFSHIGLALESGDSFTQKDRKLLILLNERLDQIDKRFEQVDKRFSDLREDMNKRFEQVDKRFKFMLQVMLAIVGAFVATVAVTIGFALWDRRTMIRPFESKVKEMEESILEDKQRLKRLINMLRKMSETDQRLADLLKSFSLL